jgi:septal ring factor EnvC (AmiA/AmiB activator)
MADLTTQLLIEIRDSIRETNASLSGRIDQTNASLSGRIDQTNERLDRMEKRQVATEVRLATELTEVSSVIRQLNDSLIEDRRFAARIADHEARISRLEQQQG